VSGVIGRLVATSTNAEAFEIDRPPVLLNQHDHAGQKPTVGADCENSFSLPSLNEPFNLSEILDQPQTRTRRTRQA
jgi:hypothetical protein